MYLHIAGRSIKVEQKAVSLYLVRLLLHGLSINTYYSIIIVISCTLMINKVTRTQRSSMYFFLLTQYTALKVLFQQRRTWTSIFSSIPWIRRRGPLGCVMSRWSTRIFLTCSTKMLVFFWLVWFISQIPKPTSDWEWHKTSRSRVHHFKIHRIILHVPTFLMGLSKKCMRSGPLNWQRQVVRAEGKTRYMEFELFQNSCCYFSQF